ncbi:hypothetical protein EHM69_03540 [candidate division KSB1 bacterium]|nr:MAG: hypothetical protein EHM69_03540 [candidate division KSB1 bacterium]
MLKRNRSLLVLLVTLIGFCGGTQALALENVIHLTTGDIRPLEDRSELVFASEQATSETKVHGLAQFYTNPNDTERARLRNAGLELLEPIPENAWLVSLSKPLSAEQLKTLGVRWGKTLSAADKLHPRVKRGEFGAWAKYKDGKVIVGVRLFADIPAATGNDLAAAAGAETGDYIESVNTWIMAIDPAMIEFIAGYEAVEWIDIIPPPLTPINNVGRQVVGANTVQAAPYGLDGSGITVCVYDGGMVDNTHSDFSGRVTLGEAGDAADHPTHVAGSVGGDGTLSGGQYRGMAPGCAIVSYQYEACDPYCLYNSPQDIAANYQQARNVHGADLTTNSIGSNTAANEYDCAWEGDYELVSQLLDNIVRGSLGSPYTVVFAAGNERGYETCGTTYSTLGVPGAAKNIITVGATEDNDAMTDFSSWGPTDDGRIKPEVCAPGSGIYSTIPGNYYGGMSGTSMATPITSGCIALMLEQFSLSYPALTPLPSTIKALLINTAVDLGNTGPDYVFGFGRINVQATVDGIIAGHFLEDELSSGETNNHTVTVASGTSTLRISLSWMDPSATPLADPALVNDLDLTVVSPGSTTYFPFILNPANPSAAATTGIDHRNNSEQIVIANPAAGEWTIHVSSTSIPSGPQSYSVAASQSILPGYGWVTGTVTDVSTMLPINGVIVRNPAGSQSMTTASDGKYQLYLPSTLLTLEYSAFGYQTSSENVSAPDHGILVRDKSLTTQPTASLFGYVYDQSGTVVSGAEITAMGTPLPSVSSGIDGFYSLNLPVGATYSVKAASTGYGAEQKFVYFSGSAHVDFHLYTLVACYDFESGDQGWARATGDNATSGLWGRLNPTATYNGSSICQPEDDHTSGTGVYCFVTDGRAGSSIGSYDVDGGKTTLLSPTWNLSGYSRAMLDLWSWYSNDEGDTPGQDTFVVDVSSDGGTSWIRLFNTLSSWEYWQNMVIPLEDYIPLTASVRVRIIAQDQTPGSIVEAAVDDICVSGALLYAPQPVSNLTISANGNDIRLQWLPSADAVRYRIERADSFSGSYLPMDSVNAGTTSYVAVDALNADQAFYHVLAIN